MDFVSKALIARVVNISRLRINEDGEGVRSVIFLHGCPLDCAWCCNPETRFQNQYYPMDGDTLFGHISQDLPYFLNGRGGLTFSGGEPMLHADFLADFIPRFCGGFSVNMETSLYANRGDILRLVPLIDEWYVDFKVFDSRRHLDLTGVSNDSILENLALLVSRKGPDKVIATYPMVPGCNVSDENVTAMIRHLKSLGIYRIQLHRYRKFQEDKHRDLGLEPVVIPELSLQRYTAIAERLMSEGFQVVSRPVVREKEKCRYLKEIRKHWRDDHGIAVDIAQCSFQGRCIGTCPKCEQELSTIRKHMEVLPWCLQMIPSAAALFVTIFWGTTVSAGTAAPNVASMFHLPHPLRRLCPLGSGSPTAVLPAATASPVPLPEVFPGFAPTAAKHWSRRPAACRKTPERIWIRQISDAVWTICGRMAAPVSWIIHPHPIGIPLQQVCLQIAPIVIFPISELPALS